MAAGPSVSGKGSDQRTTPALPSGEEPTAKRVLPTANTASSRPSPSISPVAGVIGGLPSAERLGPERGRVHSSRPVAAS